MIRIDIKPSRRLALLTALAHGAAAAAVVAVEFPPWVTTTLLFAIGVNCAAGLRRHAFLLHPESIIALRIGNEEEVQVELRGGECNPCTLLSTTFVSPWLSVLNLSAGEGAPARHTVLFEDSLDAEDFRRLRVRLRWSAGRSGQDR